MQNMRLLFTMTSKYDLLVFPERHFERIRCTDDKLDDLTASNNSFSRFIILIDLSMNKLRLVTHVRLQSEWMSLWKTDNQTKEMIEFNNWTIINQKKKTRKKRKKQINWMNYGSQERNALKREYFCTRTWFLFREQWLNERYHSTIFVLCSNERFFWLVAVCTNQM
jgi:hypothetical protein